jgi:outer membrane protein OmpA-like peptidoglycan-associated protein
MWPKPSHTTCSKHVNKPHGKWRLTGFTCISSKVTLEVREMKFTWTCLLLLVFASALDAQKTTVINHFPKDTTGKGELIPTRITEHRIVINYYEPANEQQLDQFDNLVSSYLALYIDRCAVLNDDKVNLRKSKKETLRDLNGIVKGVLDFYEYEKLKDFKGFSAMVAKKLAGIDELDFSKNNFAAGATDEDSKNRMQKFYLEKELSDLKLLANMEVGIFGDDNLMVVSSSDETVIDDGAKQRILDEYFAYDPNKTLEPIKVKLSDESMALINFKDASVLGGEAGPESAAPSGDFAAEVIKLLQSNNEKLDGMQKQIDDLRAEQMRIWQEQQDAKNVTMQKQIDDLREMVFALVKMNTGDAVADMKPTLPPSRSESTVSNVPGSMNIYFEKGSTVLDASSKLSLNEIVDILARSPGLKLIVTGYADKTGDPAKNLLLSQQRANEVKRFLAASGLSQDRFITKYFGDRDSINESKSDRKVTIEFLKG